MVRRFLEAPEEVAPAETAPSLLPHSHTYRYVAGDQVSSLFATGADADDDCCSSSCWWKEGRAVWVCKSQGQRRRRHQVKTKSEPVEKNENTGSEEEEEDNWQQHQQPSLRKMRRPELFLRARILHQDGAHSQEEEDGRILVRYPAGSTYRVRRELLVPILEDPHYQKIILVYAETNDYRRACVTHTGPMENFLEIGCAQGVTCHRVQQTSECTARNPAADDDDDDADDNNNNERAVMGLDKSDTSIATARQRYPRCRFLAADVLEPSSSFSLIMEQLVPPSVVAVDINGNREREAVLQCLEAVLAHWQPRLILVKSRALYHCVTVGGGGCSAGFSEHDGAADVPAGDGTGR